MEPLAGNTFAKGDTRVGCEATSLLASFVARDTLLATAPGEDAIAGWNDAWDAHLAIVGPVERHHLPTRA